MIEDIRNTDNPLVTLANRLEVLIADKSVDIQTADNLLNLVKVELSKATVIESTLPIIQEIERLNEIYSGLQRHRDKLNITLAEKRGKKIRGLRKQILKLKLEMGKLEQKLAELNFQIKPDPLSTVEITKRRVARLESELNKLKVGLRGIVSTQLNWEIFPSNQDIAMTLKSHFAESISKRGGSIDFDRLYRIIECFKPVRCFIGKNEFDGYLVFLLQQTNKVICDNPMIGNAIYILDGDWEKLSQQSKSELLGSHRNNIRRIIHKGNWIDRLRCAVLG